MSKAKKFNILIIGQSGRLQYEAVLFAATLRLNAPLFKGTLYVAHPQPNELWKENPSIDSESVLKAFKRLNVELLPFENKHFGESYPYGNKIEALMALPEGEPFVFFDTDTLILDEITKVPFDFERPTASLRRENTWPVPPLYGPGYTAIWKSLYDKFGLDFESSLDTSWPEEYWQRYLYFNAGFFFYKCPREFGERFLEYALAIRDDGPEELASQSLSPWLDQATLPLVIHSFGGGRNTIPEGLLDGSVSCHYRLFPLLFARESDEVIDTLQEASEINWVKKAIKEYMPMKKMIYQKRGTRIRELFDRDKLPITEQAIRKIIKQNNLWSR